MAAQYLLPHRNGPLVINESGFSLLEVLVVLAIASLLLGASFSLFDGLARARGFSENAAEIAAYLERARSFAVANSTPVRIGFYQDANQGQLVVSAFFLSAGFLSANVSEEALRDFRKWQEMAAPLSLDRLKFSATPDTLPSSGVQSALDGCDFLENCALNPMLRPVPGFQNAVKFVHIIQFSADGQAIIGRDTASEANAASPGVGFQAEAARYIAIILFENPSAKNNFAIVQINGLSGQIHLLRAEDFASL